MRRIGTVVRTPGGLVVARMTDADPETAALPETGTELVSEHLEPIGEVLEVMGPVAKPYVVIDPATEGGGSSLVGTTCYAR